MAHTDGFEVATIDDTIEAQQVASVAEKVFYDLNDDIFGSDQLQELIQLESLADNTKPNYLRLPDNASRINKAEVLYNTSTDVAEIKMSSIEYLSPTDFLAYIGSRKVSTTNEIVTDYSGYRMVIENEQAPKYYTDFDDEHLVFDAYDSTVDSVLQASKSGILTTVQRVFTKTDSYVIDFPEWMHSTYLNAVMSEASMALREEPLPTIARLARIGIIKARKKERIGSNSRATMDYGRK
jgi:hypothetical protein